MIRKMTNIANSITISVLYMLGLSPAPSITLLFTVPALSAVFVSVDSAEPIFHEFRFIRLFLLK